VFLKTHRTPDGQKPVEVRDVEKETKSFLGVQGEGGFGGVEGR
jgi:hypothetical protein